MTVLDAVIGIGANLGDRLATMRAAVRALREVREVRAVRALSSVYETDPVGGPAQPAFLNAAARVDYAGSPDALLAQLARIEAALGRVRGERWGPRVIDLDILWIAGVEVRSDALIVPHPRLTERAFALVPLAEVAPDAIDPRTGAVFPPPPAGHAVHATHAVRTTGLVLDA